MSRVIPDFWDRRASSSDVARLCAAAAVELRVIPMLASAAAPPPVRGVRCLFLSQYLPHAARTFVTLHELAHIVAGHADELTAVVLDETRYPTDDRIADGVAAIGITSRSDRELPVADLADLLRELVPVRSRAWQVYRAQATAELVREAPDLGRWGAS